MRVGLLLLVLTSSVLAQDAAPLLVRRATQLAGNDARLVCVQALYEVYSLVSPSAQRLEVVRLRLEDGSTVIQLGERARAEREQFNNRTVRVTGRLKLRPPPSALDPSPLPGPALQEIGEVRAYP